MAALSVEEVVALVGNGLGLLGGGAAGASQDGGRRIRARRSTFLHQQGELLLLLYVQFGLFEEDDDEAVEGVHLVGGEVVLGDADVLLAHPVAAPGEEALVG